VQWLDLAQPFDIGMIGLEEADRECVEHATIPRHRSLASVEDEVLTVLLDGFAHRQIVRRSPVHSQLLVELCEHAFSFCLRLALDEPHTIFAAPVRELPDDPTGAEPLSMNGSHCVTVAARRGAL